MFSHLLVPLDGSEYALHALRCAEDLAKASEARLTLLSVIPRPEGAGTTQVEGVNDEERAHLAAELESLSRMVGSRSALNRVDSTVRFGEPAHQITDFAKSETVDLIVMGTYGLGATGRYALGSIALKVLMTAECPVFVVRFPGQGPVPT